MTAAGLLATHYTGIFTSAASTSCQAFPTANFTRASASGLNSCITCLTQLASGKSFFLRDINKGYFDACVLEWATCSGAHIDACFPDLDDRTEFLLLARSLRFRWGRTRRLCPGSSDVNLFSYSQGIVHFDA